MSYYENNFKMPNSYLYGNSGGYGSMPADGGMGMAGNAAGAGATGFAMGGPVGAAIGVGGSFLTQYLAQRAQEEENRKKALADASRYESDSKINALNSMTGGYGRALGV